MRKAIRLISITLFDLNHRELTRATGGKANFKDNGGNESV